MFRRAQIGFSANSAERRLRRCVAEKMAWSAEKCDAGVETELGVVRPATGAHTEEAVEALRAGKVIAVPTDTLYGFACDAWYDNLSNAMYLFVKIPQCLNYCF